MYARHIIATFISSTTLDRRIGHAICHNKNKISKMEKTVNKSELLEDVSDQSPNRIPGIITTTKIRKIIINGELYLLTHGCQEYKGENHFEKNYQYKHSDSTFLVNKRKLIKFSSKLNVSPIESNFLNPFPIWVNFGK